MRLGDSNDPRRVRSSRRCLAAIWEDVMDTLRRFLAALLIAILSLFTVACGGDDGDGGDDDAQVEEDDGDNGDD
jgi:hypothetical protein